MLDMRMNSFSSLVLWSLISVCWSVQEWEEQPSSTFVNPGGEVLLSCRIRDKRGDCRWEQRRDNGQTQPLGFYPGKREWSGDRGSGDCSIRIYDADYEYDNGRYVCQVTASGFRESDTLISREAVLSVRVPPAHVEMRRQSGAGELETRVTAAAGDHLDLECLVTGGNPPPRVHWFIGSSRVDGAMETEDQESRTLVSRLSFVPSKDDAEKIVKCVVEHGALEQQMESTALLDIQYPPQIELESGSEERVSVVEGESVNMSCQVDAKPAASVSWRHLNSGQVVSFSSHLLLPSISRTAAGRYVCLATNELGQSQSQEALIDVKYGATVISVEPEGVLDKMYETDSVELRCHAEANPLPSYRWLHHTGHGSVILGHQRTLKLDRVTYADQGEYSCEVSNDISSSQSQSVTLNVHGPPRVNTNNKHLFLIEGSDASVEVEFCGSPLPKQTWQIESVENKLSLVAGTSHDIYSVDQERKSDTNNCYITTLRILSIDQHQAKDFVLTLENEHGEEIHKAHVTVGEEISKKTLIGSLIGVAATFLLVLCLSICWCRRCCKHDKQLKNDPERPL